MNYLEETPLKKLFAEYMGLSVVLNQHLIDTLFHVLMGIIFPIRIVYSGKYIRCRICNFMIQPSGTGKTQAMEGLMYLLLKLIPREKVFLATSISTDAALIGSPDFSKKKEQAQSRLLTKKDVLFWDEGSVLLKDGPHAESFQDIIQSATDEPGKIGKALKDGTITGYTNTTIIAGSYFEDNIKYQLLKRGFFQRMLTTYKTFSDGEKLEIQRQLGKLECSTSYNDRVKLEEQIRELLIDEYGLTYGTPWDKYKLITNPESTIKYFTDKCVDYYTKYIMYQYLDRRQNILETFWNRSRLLILKISAQNAFLHHRITTAKEDIDYAFDLVEKHHISGTKELLNRLSDKKEVYKKIDIQNEREVVLKYIGLLNQKNKGEIIQKQLIEFIKEVKRKGEVEEEKLHLGVNKVWDIVKELEKAGKLDVRVEGKCKYMKVKSQNKV